MNSLYLIRIGAAQNTRRPENQRKHQEEESKDILIVTGDIACEKTFRHAQYQASQYGARHAADTAQNRCHKGLDTGDESYVIIDLSRVGGDQNPPQCGGGRPDNQ